MKKLLGFMVSLCPLLSLSQRLHINLSGGLLNYQGDLQHKPFTFDQSVGAMGAGLTYDLNNYFSVRSSLMYGKISADDQLNKPSLRIRNLSFESKIIEGNLLAEYNLFNLYDKNFTPYIFGGVGIYHFDPYAYDTLGNKVFLQVLSTEGQGLTNYPKRKKYKLTQLNIPFGGGFKLKVSENVVIGYEIGMRKLFTDHLDDVSTTYVDQAELFAAKGPKAVEMAYRGGEIKNGNQVYPIEGSLRGGATQKDWYYFQGITLNIGLFTRNGDGWRGRGNNMGCPVRIL